MATHTFTVIVKANTTSQASELFTLVARRLGEGRLADKFKGHFGSEVEYGLTAVPGLGDETPKLEDAAAIASVLRSPYDQ